MSQSPWWLGQELSVGAEGLSLEGLPIARVAREIGTPVYLYSPTAILRRVAELREALRSTGVPFRVHYAMKANRFRPILDLIRREGDVGIDASSPREVAAAMEAGFQPSEISVTCSMPSNRDLDFFAAQRVHVNLDTRSALRRWAATAGALRSVGLRLDPAVALGYDSAGKLSYGSSKFGFPLESIAETAEYAHELGLEVDTLHVHPGWGMQERAAGPLENLFSAIAVAARQIPSLRRINVGGGLCWRQTGADQPLALATWARLLRDRLGPLGLELACESGTYVTASAGVLVTEVNTVEARRGVEWIGLDAGHNVNVYAAHYSIPHEIIHVTRSLAAAEKTYSIGGNVNEPNDVFARGLALPEVREGDLLAFFPAGAYGSSMASDHCLKGLPREKMLSGTNV